MPRARTLVYKPDGTLKDPTVCEFCGARVARPCDLHRHMQKHLRGEERASRSFSCPYSNCDFQSLQKGNMDTHIRSVHTRIKDQECPDCEFATADPGSLTRHRKRRHEYVPERRKPRAEQTLSTSSASGTSDIIIINSGNRYPGHNPGRSASEVPQAPKALNQKASNPKLNASNTTRPPRPPSIAGLLNALQPEPPKTRPPNLAALLNPLPEPVDISKGVGEASTCCAEQTWKMDRQSHPLYGFSRCTS
ncbi:uncharacterized protein C8R40DRAFT_1090767 [Lentinula edodes]|uniref:uncharacterized protein n=1 Tax=Lentinula edodes TaxID=5353 RepID=UPI001E8E2887|nr:uncharacterized protein C8R40DRAFT_1090767 [Lentinula edodes]KAH7878696.1 hypothetical protein C8R40DRAFT_1090767 [Lentinula edodes]